MIRLESYPGYNYKNYVHKNYAHKISHLLLLTNVLTSFYPEYNYKSYVRKNYVHKNYVHKISKSKNMKFFARFTCLYHFVQHQQLTPVIILLFSHIEHLKYHTTPPMTRMRPKSRDGLCVWQFPL